MKKTLLSGILVLTAFASNAQIPTNGLVANYSFNNGNANDEVGSNHGTVNGATLTEDRFGNSGQAYQFNGNSNIDLGDASEFQFGTGDFSISLWAKYTSSQLSYIIGKRDPLTYVQYGILVSNASLTAADNTIRGYVRDNNGFDRNMGDGSGYNTDQWHHFVLTHSQDSSVLYINNVKIEVNINNFAVLGSLSVDGYPLVIGASNALSANSFGGQIDDVRIYNRTLDAQEIAALFNEPAPVTPIVYIPDVNFKNYLLEHMNINTVNDGEISYAEAAAFTGTINCTNMGISDLTGIEAFINLTILYCGDNPLTTSLDISQNTSLTTVLCNDNQLASLDVSNNIALTGLFCYNNQLTSLDVSNNTTLTDLYCYQNNLTSLNVANGNNTNFIQFRADYNSDLTCIQVDNVAGTTNWTGSNFAFDTEVTFNENCSLGIGEVWNTELIEVYPNPASTVLNISFNTGETTVIKIVNVLGETVISTYFGSTQHESLNNQNNSIDVSGLTKGVYFVQSGISTGSLPVVKFVKE